MHSHNPARRLVLWFVVAAIHSGQAFLAARVFPTRSTTLLRDTEESEWYSPPVQVKPVPLKQPGMVASEVVVTTPDDLMDFIFADEEERISIVKYHANW